MAWLTCASVALWCAGSSARAADSETREFTVFVDGKSAGSASIKIQRQDDGTTTVHAETNVQVRVLLIKYTYSYSGREVWKNGRLQSFSSRCNDDGKQYRVSGVAQERGVRITVNGRETCVVKPEMWLTSYWTLPNAKVREKVVDLIDADNGNHLRVNVERVGGERITVAGQERNVQHYRLTGSVKADLWYDGAERLVRSEWVESGHRTALELARVRR
jgi:hypothetical protein